MGFRICYIACKVPPAQIVEALALEATQPVTEMPNGEWWVAVLKHSGWTVLWSEEEHFGRKNRDSLASLSKVSDVYLCEVNETVMWSSAEFWSGGQQVWAVAHAGDRDMTNLTETGDAPPSLAALKETHFTAQRTEDDHVDHIFEIPLNLAATDIGFRHEDYLEPTDVNAFIPLRPPRRKTVMSSLFGR